MQSEGSWHDELEALAAHNAIISVGVKGQCQRALLLEAQHRVLLEVPLAILVFPVNVVKDKRPVVVQCLLLRSGGGGSGHGCIHIRAKFMSTEY